MERTYESIVTGVAGQLGHDVMNELAKEVMKESEAISLLPTAVYKTKVR